MSTSTFTQLLSSDLNQADLYLNVALVTAQDHEEQFNAVAAADDNELYKSCTFESTAECEWLSGISSLGEVITRDVSRSDCLVMIAIALFTVARSCSLCLGCLREGRVG